MYTPKDFIQRVNECEKITEIIYEIITQKPEIVILRGALGWGKTTIAGYVSVYNAISKEEDITQISMPIIWIPSINKDYRRLKYEYLVDILKRTSENYNPDWDTCTGSLRLTTKPINKCCEKGVEFDLSNNIIGRNVFSAYFDDDYIRSLKYTEFIESFDNTFIRIKSRYCNKNHGPLIITGSEDLWEIYKDIKEKYKNYSIMEYRHTRNNMFSQKYSGQYFTVKVTFDVSQEKVNILLNDSTKISSDTILAQVDVPIEYKSEFMLDAKQALKDFAGIDCCELIYNFNK